MGLVAAFLIYAIRLLFLAIIDNPGPSFKKHRMQYLSPDPESMLE